ncbi:MAG TPA: GNAT family N-acetyltransferase [Pseudomonadales bacterium]
MLVPATPQDLDWLIGLRLITMAEHFERAGEHLTTEDQRARVLRDFDAIRIVMVGSERVGMLKVTRLPDLWHLVQIQILPVHQRKGLGGRLIQALLQDASQAGVPVVLRVLKVNPAKRLYDRLGFRVTAEYGNSYEMRFEPARAATDQ